MSYKITKLRLINTPPLAISASQITPSNVPFFSFSTEDTGATLTELNIFFSGNAVSDCSFAIYIGGARIENGTGDVYLEPTSQSFSLFSNGEFITLEPNTEVAIYIYNSSGNTSATELTASVTAVMDTNK